MRSFNYTIKDETGIHARPAGMLVKAAKSFKSEILIKKGEKAVNATRLIQLMGLGIKCGDTVTVSVGGEDEAEAADALQRLFSENL